MIKCCLGSEPLSVVFLPSDCRITGLRSFAQPFRWLTDRLALLFTPKLFSVVLFLFSAKHFCFFSQLSLPLEISPLGFLSLLLFFPKTQAPGETSIIFVLRFVCS